MLSLLRRTKLGRVAGVAVVVFFDLVTAVPMSAITEASWIDEQLPEIETMDVTGLLPATCNQSKMTVAKLDGNKLPYLDSVDVCLTRTQFGAIGIGHDGTSIGPNAYLQKSGSLGGLAYELNLGVDQILPVPNADFFISRWRPSGSVAWVRATTFWENPSSFSLDLLTLKYRPSADTISKTLNQPGTSTRFISYPGAAISSNGKWMVLESNPLKMVDLESKEIVGSFGNNWTYGIGANPTVNLAVSNDGEYVVQTARSSITNDVIMNDLATCTFNPDTPLVRNSDCANRSWRQYIGSKFAGSIGFSSPYFNDDASTLTLRVTEPGVGVKDVMLFKPSYQHGLLDYLALGDSFSSGEGDRDGDIYYLPGTDGDGDFEIEKCHLSTRSYPYQLSTRRYLSEDLAKSISCSGAVIADVMGGTKNDKVYRGQYNQYDGMGDNAYKDQIVSNSLINFYPGRAAQIEFVKKYKPETITLTIGGNDVGFGHKLTVCLASNFTLGDGTCYYSIQRKGTAMEIQRQFDVLKDLYTDLQVASPKTQIYVLGYPQFFGDSTCGVNVILGGPEREYITQSIAYMNQVIESAAKASGVSYVDVSNSLAGNNLCSDAADIAFNGTTIGDDQLKFIGNESYHPNEIGHSLIATSVLGQFPDMMDRQKCGGIKLMCPDASIHQPDIPEYFETNGSVAMPYLRSFTDQIVNKAEAIANPGEWLDFMVDNLAPGTTASVTLHSEPTTLGAFTVDNNGVAHVQADIPAEVEFGYHTLHVYATTIEGEEVDFYQPLMYINSEEDADGDGTPDAEQQCVFICIEEEHDDDVATHLPEQASEVAKSRAPLNEVALIRAAHSRTSLPEGLVKGVENFSLKPANHALDNRKANDDTDELPLLATSVVGLAAGLGLIARTTTRNFKKR